MSEQNQSTADLLAAISKEKENRASQASGQEMLSRVQVERQRRLNAAQQPQRPSFGSELVRGSRGVVEGLAQAVSGSAQMRGIPTSPEMPDTLGSSIGETATGALMSAVPLGVMAARVQPATQGVNRILAMLQNSVSNMGRSFKDKPVSFLAAETALGGTAGIGGFAAERRYPDSDAARFIGEMIGGSLPSVASDMTNAAFPVFDRAMRALPGPGTAIRTWEQVARNASPKTSAPRASSRFERAAGDTTPRQIISNMNEELLPEARALMTPAQLANNPGLLALEKSVIESTDTLKNKSVDQLQRLNDVIVQSLTRGSSDAAGVAAEQTQRSYYTLLNESVNVAARRADEAIERLIPGAPAEQANRIARRELETASKASVEQETQLFELIDGATPTLTNNTRQMYRDIQVEMGAAGKEEIPALAESLFGRKGRLGAETTVKEMRTAQRLFRAKAREARVGANPNFTQSRIYERLANAITEDFSGIGGDQSDVIQNAVAYSRQRNEVFGQGTVGKILRGAADSGDVIPEALTLRNTLGLGGPGGAQAYDDIVSALGFAAVNADYRTYENAASVMEGYVKNEFMRSVVRDGQVNPTLAATFIRENEEILRRLPALGQEINQASSAQTARGAYEALRVAGIDSFTNPLTSKAAVLINKGPTKAFTDVFSSTNPATEMRKLVDIVGADATGEGLEGLKAGFFDYLLDSVSSNGVVSGDSLLELLKDTKFKSAASSLLSAPEMQNLGIVARTAQRADAARAATTSLEGITGDKTSALTDMSLRVLGAAGGRWLSKFFGGGTIQIPAILSSKLKELGAYGLLNPARDLVIASMMDEELFRKVLLNNVLLDRPMTADSINLMNAWALNALAQQGLSGSEQEQQQ